MARLEKLLEFRNLGASKLRWDSKMSKIPRLLLQSFLDHFHLEWNNRRNLTEFPPRVLKVTNKEWMRTQKMCEPT